MSVDESAPVIDLYWISIEAWRASLTELEGVLAKDEQERAIKFVSREDRIRFVVSRGWLRRILNHYVGVEPDRLEIKYGCRGKPFIKSTFRFNLSHSKNYTAIAVSDRFPIGIDIESPRVVRELRTVARKVFSDREIKIIDDCKESNRLGCFLKLWTRKEAYLKATGQGLFGNLRSTSVGFERSVVDGGAGQPWTIVDLPRFAGHAAALCAPGRYQWKQCPLPGTTRPAWTNRV